MKPLLLTAAFLLLTAGIGAIAPETISVRRTVPPEIAGHFRDPRGFQQSASGQYFVFDRRGHTVFGVDEPHEGYWRIVQIGAEPGRIIEPTAFSVAPDGTFVVADAPDNRPRIQVFSPAGFRIAGFTLGAAVRPRIVSDSFVTSGLGSLQYTGASILLSQPETGALVTEYDLSGRTSRSFGTLRSTEQDADTELRLAFNSGIPLAAPGGGFYFVFQAGLPAFRKYDGSGRLLLERQLQGREIDELLPQLPTFWPRNRGKGEFPVVTPTIRAAAVDARSRLWLSLATPYTYVYDPDGDKVRTIQLRGTGIVAPNSLFFGSKGRLLVTPGLHEFDVD